MCRSYFTTGDILLCTVFVPFAFVLILFLCIIHERIQAKASKCRKIRRGVALAVSLGYRITNALLLLLIPVSPTRHEIYQKIFGIIVIITEFIFHIRIVGKYLPNLDTHRGVLEIPEAIADKRVA